MPVQVFVDDSGGKGHSQHFVLLGLASNSERWMEFAEEWRDCLNQHPPVPVFKMREAANRTGAFYKWSEKGRDDRLRSLAQIINRHVEYVIHTTIDIEAHQKTWAKLPKPQSELYFWAYHTVILGNCFDLWEHGWREKFEIIFDEQMTFGERARTWYPLFQEMMRLKHPDEFSVLPDSPIFGTDDQFLPIQAADLFAWCIRKNTDDPEANAFQWLLEEMPNVSESSYCNYYDLERLSAVLSESHRMAEQAEVPHELIRMHQQTKKRKAR